MPRSLTRRAGEGCAIVATQRSVLAEHGSYCIRLLGPFDVARGGEPLEVSEWYRPVQSLLKILCVTQGHRRRKEEIVELLWPDSSPGSGDANLRSTLRRLRESLGGHEPSPVLYRQGWVALNPEYDWLIDLDTFEKAVEDAGVEPVLLERALSMVQGEPLVEDRYEDWATLTRERVLRLYRDASLELARRLEERGEPDRALEHFDRVAAADPLDEEAGAGAIRALCAVGRRSEAMRRYRALALRLHDELGVEPGTTLKDHSSACMRTPRASFPLVRSGRPRPRTRCSTCRPATGFRPERFPAPSGGDRAHHGGTCGD